MARPAGRTGPRVNRDQKAQLAIRHVMAKALPSGTRIYGPWTTKFCRGLGGLSCTTMWTLMEGGWRRGDEEEEIEKKRKKFFLPVEMIKEGGRRCEWSKERQREREKTF